MDTASARTSGPNSGAPRASELARLAGAYLRRHPVALGFALTTACAGLLAEALGAAAPPLGAGPQQLLQLGRVWTLVTALLVPSSVAEAVVVVLLSLTVLARAETLLGARRTVAALLGLGVLSVALSVPLQAVLWTIAGLHPFAGTEAPVLDPVVAVAAVVMCASAAAPGLWRRRIRLVGFGVLAMFALYAGDADSWYRLTGAVVGLVAGAVLLRRGRTHAWHRSSIAETRSLLAMIVAVTAVGPFAALLTVGGRGPLSLVADMFAQVDQRLADACARQYFPACDDLTAAVVTRGVGPALLAVLPLVLLAVAAWGLRAGRRAAWILAVVVASALIVQAIARLVSGVDVREFAGDGLDIAAAVLADLVVPALLVAALLLSRRAFGIVADGRTAIRAAVVVAIAAVVAAGVYVAAAAMGRADFGRADFGSVATTPAQLVLGALRRLLPPGLAGGEHPYPHRGLPLIAYQWVGVAFWAVTVVALLRVFGSRRRLADSDGAAYRALVRRGGGSLAWIGTWDGNRYWYSADGQAAVAYRLVGGVALAVGGPVGAPDAADEAVAGFAEMCAQRNWVVAFYGVDDALLPLFDRRGWEHLSVAEETVIDLDGFDLAGKAWQKVRQPVARAEREGLRAVWARWDELAPGVVAQIGWISEAWVVDRALPEMRFTLGTIAEAKDPEVQLMVALDADDRVQGVTSWMPAWHDGALVGRTLDLMRRRADGPNGVMEFLIAKTALRCAADGLAFVSLSGAPLATRPSAPTTAPRALDTLLVWLAEALEPVYGFASLFRFKAKFHPRYAGLHLAYADPAALPLIGTAVGRAYLPDARAGDVLALAREVVGGRS